MNRTSRRLGAALLMMSCAGCYRYVPADLQATPPGTPVRLLVTRSGSGELAEVMPLEGQAPTVKGTLVSLEDDDLIVSVDIARRQEGFQTSALEQRVRIPAGEVVSFERREVNTLATAATMTAVAGGVGVLVALVSQSLKGNSPETPTPPNELTARFPLVSIPLGGR